MKIFQIFNEMCYYDVTAICPTLADTQSKYPPSVTFVEAPDYVFCGWGFDNSNDGNDRFIKPVPPEGWVYDDETGCFKQTDEPEQHPESETSWDQMEAAYIEGVNEA